MLRMVNRTAVIVRPKEPFLAWAVDVFSHEEKAPTRADVEEALLGHEPRVYLIPYTEEPVAFGRAMRKCFDLIFESELDGWCTDEDSWPGHRDWGTFRKWFDWKEMGEVLDTCEDGLRLH